MFLDVANADLERHHNREYREKSIYARGPMRYENYMSELPVRKKILTWDARAYRNINKLVQD